MHWACRGRMSGRWAERSAPPAERARWSLACEAMRPAATTERWHRFAAAADKKEMAAALTGHVRGRSRDRRGGSRGHRAHAARGGGDAGQDGQPHHARSRPGAARGGAARRVGHRRRGRGGPAVRQNPSRRAARSGCRGGGEAVRARRADDTAQASALPRRHGGWRDATGDQRAGAGRLPVALFRQGPARAWRRRWRERSPDPGGTRRSAASRTPTGRLPAIC